MAAQMAPVVDSEQLPRRGKMHDLETHSNASQDPSRSWYRFSPFPGEEVQDCEVRARWPLAAVREKSLNAGDLGGYVLWMEHEEGGCGTT